MYCSHFGLQRLPFNNTPDPTFYYSTPDHEEALATLQYATRQRKGFVLVSGEIGAGKTLIGRIFLRQMDTNSTTAVISQTNLTGRQLLAAICSEFGLAAPAEASNLELTQRLQDFLVEQFARNRFVVVLLDEAQNLPDESFEELRMLGNLEADDAKLLQVCILGQPELRERFSSPGMKQLDQRLFRRFHLPSLNRVQTGEYVIHRLGVAGCRNEQLFTPDAVERIYAASGGVPRLINQICDNALLTAYGRDERSIDGHLIDLVLERDGSLSLQGAAHPESPSTAGGASRGTGAADRVRGAGEARRPVECEPADCPAGADADSADTVDSVHLAELALQQTESLCSEVAALASTAAPLRSELDQISQRQSELHKIVAGATTRWLAAKEKFDEYRREIQSEIREVIVRCHHTQEKLKEVERTAAPVEDLDEIRENHLRETSRILKLMQTQRDEFQARLEDIQKQWSGSEQELRRMAAQARSDDRFADLQTQCEAATREVLATVDRHRQSMFEHLAVLRQQCEAAQNQLQTVQTTFERRCSEADRRVEQLRTDWSAHEKELAVLREQLEGWQRTLQEGVEELKAQLAAQSGDTADQECRRDLQDLRREQASCATALERRIDGQAASLQEFRRTLEQAALHSDLLHRRSVEQVAARAAELEARLEQARQELAAGQRAFQAQLDELERTWESRLDERDRAWQHQVSERERAWQQEVDQRDQALRQQADQRDQVWRQQADQRDRAWRDQLDERDRAWQSQLEQRETAFARLDELKQVQQSQTGQAAQIQAVAGESVRLERSVGELAARIDSQHDALETGISQVRGQVGGLEKQMADLSAFRDEQECAAGLILQQLEQQRRSMREDVESLTQRYQGLESGLDALRDAAVVQDELEAVRVQHAADLQSLRETLSGQEQALESFASRVRERSDAVSARLDDLARDAARAGQVDQIRQALHDQILTLSKELSGHRAEWTRAFSASAGRAEQLAASLLKVAQQSATREELAIIQQQQERLDAQLRRELDERSQQQDEQFRRLEARLASTQEQVRTGQARHEAAVADLSGRWDALRASLEQLARDTVAAETFNRLERSLSADVSQLRDQLADTTSEHTQVVRTLVEKVQETAGRVATLESTRQPRPLELQPEVLASLGKLVEAAEAERTGLGEALERAGAVTAHLRNCSSQVQEIMEHWMSGAGEVREQSEGLRTAGENARAILEAMRKCNAVLDAKLNSQRWRSELERGEALSGRLEQAVSAAQGVVRRIESLMADFDAARTELDAWEQRQRQARESAARLADLLAQAQSRQRMLAAVARNTSQLMEVIQAARLEDETRHPTPPARGGGADSGNGHTTRGASRIQWPKLSSPAAVGARS